MDKAESYNKESICMVYENTINDGNTVNAASTFVMNNPLKHSESNFIQSSEG